MEDFYVINEPIYLNYEEPENNIKVEGGNENNSMMELFDRQAGFEDCFNSIFKSKENLCFDFGNEYENYIQQDTSIPIKPKNYIFQQNLNEETIVYTIIKEEINNKKIGKNLEKKNEIEKDLYEKPMVIDDEIENEKETTEENTKKKNSKKKKKKHKKKKNYTIFKEGSNELFKMLNEAKQKKKKNQFFIVDHKIEGIKESYQKRRKRRINKKKEKLKKKRKFKPDDIRKKIKARFHKAFKNVINEKLKISGSKEFFDFLPQSFVSNISKQKNKEVMKLTYRQILEKDFTKELKNNKPHKKKVDKAKYDRNLKVLKYLDNNIEISKNSGFDIISKMIYSDILNEYFSSLEFENSILKLKSEEENEDYINEYLVKAKTYVKFFMKHKEIDYKEDSIIVSDEEMYLEK